MLIETIVRAARILQAEPAYTMPLTRLHSQLVKELGPEAGSYAQVYQQLKKRADSFLIVDSPRVLGGIDSWPGFVREEYDAALGGAGLGSIARVTLTEAPPSGEAADLIAAMSGTMAQLLSAPETDAELRDFIERATQAVAEVSRVVVTAAAVRPTTLPPDAPPGG